jgi:diacylglycerol kinase family enzyme/membrane-associated phospholipid phosphatase
MTLRERVTAADRMLLSRLSAPGRRPGLVAGQVMPWLSRAADHSVLWIVVAAGLGSTHGKWARRAALRGLAGVAISSAAANVIGKGLVGRARPTSPQAVPAALLRQRGGTPRTTSFPSGHAASAAAFATGVALEMPVLAAPVGGLAAAVGASRLITGVHYPSDVAAGFALGTACGALTLRWWPRRPAKPAAAARPRREAPASPDGAGLVLIVNCSAGHASDDLAETLAKNLPAAEVVVASTDDDLDGLFRDAAARAAIMGVAGGDGSVRLAAGIASDAGLPLLVVPAGTFNHFAADLGVRSVDDALAALAGGDSVLVDVATADGQAFLNTASAGAYADLVRAREQIEPALGKWPAMMIALITVLRDGRPVDLVVNGRHRKLWLLFAGNCRYEPSGAAPGYRPNLADGTLDIRLIDGSQPLARTRLIAAVLLGTLGRCRVYRTWSAQTLRIRSPGPSPLPLSLDGEVTERQSVIRLVKRPKKLLVYRPSSAE